MFGWFKKQEPVKEDIVPLLFNEIDWLVESLSNQKELWVQHNLYDYETCEEKWLVVVQAMQRLLTLKCWLVAKDTKKLSECWKSYAIDIDMVFKLEYRIFGIPSPDIHKQVINSYLNKLWIAVSAVVEVDNQTE